MYDKRTGERIYQSVVGMSLTNIMNQVYDDNDAFIRTVLYEFVKG